MEAGTPGTEKRRIAEGYFRQEGLLDGVPYAVIDSGWTGASKERLSQILGREVEGFYFGLYGLPAGSDEKTFHTYAMEPYGDVRRKARFSICLFEAACSAPEGMTEGYAEENGRFFPIRKASGNPNAEAVRRFAELTAGYASAYASCPAQETAGQGHGETASIALENLLALCGSPTGREAELFGSLLFDEGVREERLRPVAARWDKAELERQGFLRRVMRKIRRQEETKEESGWREGSIVLAAEEPGRMLAGERLYKTLRNAGKAVLRDG